MDRPLRLRSRLVSGLVLAPRLRAVAGAIALALAGSPVAHAQTFQRLYGTAMPEAQSCIEATGDGGFITVGVRTPGPERMFITKHRPNGVLDWVDQYGAGRTTATSGVQTSDLGYAVVGFTDAAAGGLGLTLLRLDPFGNFLFSIAYTGNTTFADPINVYQTAAVRQFFPDLGFVVATSYPPAAAAGEFGQLLRTTPGGAPVFNRTYFDPRFGSLSRIAFSDLRVDPNGIWVVGTTVISVQPLPGGPFVDQYCILLVRFDPLGNPLFNFTYTVPSTVPNSPIRQWGDGLEVDSATGDIFIVGRLDEPTAASASLHVLRVTPAGALVWSRVFSNLYSYGAFRNIRRSFDASVVIAGSRSFVPAGSTAGPAMLLDVSVGGLFNWCRSYGPLTGPPPSEPGTGGVPFFGARPGYALVAHKTLATGFGGKDIFVARTDATGTSKCYEDQVLPPISVPNVLLAEIPLQVIDNQDFAAWQGVIAHFGNERIICEGCTCPGDANHDGVVNFADITSVFANWLVSYAPGSGPGDANCDGVVNFADTTSVFANWGAVCPP